MAKPKPQAPNPEAPVKVKDAEPQLTKNAGTPTVDERSVKEAAAKEALVELHEHVETHEVKGAKVPKMTVDEVQFVKDAHARVKKRYPLSDGEIEKTGLIYAKF